MPPMATRVESHRVVHSGIFAVGESLLSRKNELGGSENRDYSGGGARIFVESALCFYSNCVTPTTELENYKIETQRAFNEQESVIDYYKSLQKPKLKLLEENPTVELTRYNHFSFRNKTEYCRIARLGISNIGDATVNGIKVIIKDFSWVENRYDGMVLRPKDDFNVHSNGSFNLPSKDVKYIDIALRKEAEFNYHEARTYLRLVAPDYFNTCIGDNEIIGLKIQVVAPNHPPLEMKVDIYLEKMQLTNQDGEVSYFKRLMCRTSTAEENAPTEIRMYQE